MRHEPLRTARQAAGISLTRMAKIVGIDKGNLSRVETGQSERTKLREVAMLYDLALGNQPYTLVRECGDLPATLGGAPKSAIPGWLTRLSTITVSRPQALRLPPACTLIGRPLSVASA